MKKLLPFFLFLSFFLTPTFASAFAVTREMQLVDQALNSNATTSFNDVRAMNGTISGNVSQRVNVGGSAGTISQPISFPASAGAAARAAAGLAGRIAGGYAAIEGAKWAVQKLLDGIDYAMHDGAIVKHNKDYDSTVNKDTSYQCVGYYPAPMSASLNVCAAGYAAANSLSSNYSCTGSTAVGSYVPCTFHRNDGSATNLVVALVVSTPQSNSPKPEYSSVTPQQTQDAMHDWLVNNPTSLTDPVYQAFYTPAQTTGWNLTGEEGAHYGNDGITDEMVNNILSARNAALTGSQTYTLNDSVIPNVDGTSTETTTNPDGSKKTTNTSVTTDKGKRTTTAIETTTNPDGTTSTKTTTKTEDVPQTYPAACEWFATACEWFGWTQKDDPINDDPQIDQSDLPTPTLSENAVSWGSQCPNPQLINFNLMGQTANIQLSWTPVCTLLSYLYYPILAGAYIAAAYIVIGAYKS